MNICFSGETSKLNLKMTTFEAKKGKSKFDKIELSIRQYSLYVSILKMPSILDIGLF
jgi:hypothetical protein